MKEQADGSKDRWRTRRREKERGGTRSGKKRKRGIIRGGENREEEQGHGKEGQERGETKVGKRKIGGSRGEKR